MMNTRSITRLLTLGLGAVALVACGDNGGGTDTAGNTDSSTTASTSESATTVEQTTKTTKDTEEPTAGSMSATGDDTGTSTSDSDATGPITVTESGSSSTGPVAPVCGDGTQDGTEECDDGNNVDGDGCQADCTLTPACGNGKLEEGEACDDGNTVDGDDCSADCSTVTQQAKCGDGETQDPEQCDDGNNVDGDGCQADCTITPPECGNGIKEADEQCDDGNDVNDGPGDFCTNDCKDFVPASCNAPAMYTNCDDAINLADKNDKKNALKAIGICDGDLATSIVTTDFQFESQNPLAWQVAKGFGSYKFDNDMDPATPDQLLYSPREGSTFLMMSTGIITAPDAQGIVTAPLNSQVNNGQNLNNGTNELPPPFKVAKGSNDGVGGTPFIKCDAAYNDCSDTLQDQWTKGGSDPNDRAWFTFKTKVPAGTHGYSFDFVFCSSEWPVFVNTKYNDLLIVYQVDPSADDPNAMPPVDPYSGNVTFIPDPNDAKKGLPLTITALDPYLKKPGYNDNKPQLTDTGFETHACSDWFSAKGGVQPGAEITVGFYIADMVDTALATVALIDNFRWDCKGCVPSEVDDCGIQPPM